MRSKMVEVNEGAGFKKRRDRPTGAHRERQTTNERTNEFFINEGKGIRQTDRDGER